MNAPFQSEPVDPVTVAYVPHPVVPRPAVPPFPGAPGMPYPAPYPMPPHGGAAGVPVVGVEPLGLSLPCGEGFTLRGQLRPYADLVEYIFPEVDGALPLFRDRDALLRQAAALPGDPLYAAPTWPMAAITDDRRFDLAFVPDHLADGPDAWFPAYLTRCRDLCAQLALFFELEDVAALLEKGSLLDTLDDTLRHSGGAVLGWRYRRQLARLDTAEVVRQWQTIIDAIDRLARFAD